MYTVELQNEMFYAIIPTLIVSLLFADLLSRPTSHYVFYYSWVN